MRSLVASGPRRLLRRDLEPPAGRARTPTARSRRPSSPRATAGIAAGDEVSLNADAIDVLRDAAPAQLDRWSSIADAAARAASRQQRALDITGWFADLRDDG